MISRSSLLRRFMALLLLLAPCSVIASGEAPIYQSHFEDNLHQLTDWTTSDPPSGAQVNVRALDEAPEAAPDARAALTIENDATSAPLRINQTTDLFKLEPERAYSLNVTYRAPHFDLQKGGRVRFFVTDARWQWSSPALLIREPSDDWTTLSLPFTAPDGEHPHFRIRFEAIRAALQIEVAQITITPQ